MSCPCGSGNPFDACCGKFLSGDALPETAEELMRSRYSAYTKANIDYIAETHHEEAGDDFDRAGALQWATESTWKGLEIVGTSAGQKDDDTGVVEFVARFSMKGKLMAHHERSEFVKRDGKWLYKDGGMVKQQPVVREGRKIGRNEPCPCKSGKKYKKCCGK